MNRLREPMVSVIVPVYNKEEWLAPCIESVLRQTFSDFELILVDDGSTDGSLVLEAKFAAEDERIRRIVLKENGGPSAARNRGISVARGRYITFLDADDWIDPDYLLTLCRAAEKYRADVIGMGYVATMVQDGIWQENKVSSYPTEWTSVLHEDGRKKRLALWIKSSFMINTAWGKLYRRRLLLENGIIFSPKARVTEDILFSFCVVCYAKTFVFLKDTMYRCRQTETSITRGGTSKEKFEMAVNAVLEAGRMLQMYIDRMPEIKADNKLCRQLQVFMGAAFNHMIFDIRSQGLSIKTILSAIDHCVSKTEPQAAHLTAAIAEMMLRKFSKPAGRDMNVRSRENAVQ